MILSSFFSHNVVPSRALQNLLHLARGGTIINLAPPPLTPHNKRLIPGIWESKEFLKDLWKGLNVEKKERKEKTSKFLEIAISASRQQYPKLWIFFLGYISTFWPFQRLFIDSNTMNGGVGHQFKFYFGLETNLLLMRYSFTLGHVRLHVTTMPHVTFSSLFLFLFLTWSLFLGDLVQNKAGLPPILWPMSSENLESKGHGHYSIYCIKCHMVFYVIVVVFTNDISCE